MDNEFEMTVVVWPIIKHPPWQGVLCAGQRLEFLPGFNPEYNLGPDIHNETTIQIAEINRG